MDKNRKGAVPQLTMLTLIGGGALIVLIIFGVILIGLQQQALPKGNGDGAPAPSLIGKAATIQQRVKDRAADNTETQRAVPLYTYQKNADGTLYFLEDGTVTSTTSTTDSSTSVGETWCSIAINNSYYGEEKCFDVKTEGDKPIDLSVWKVGTNTNEDGKVELKDKDSTSWQNILGNKVNLTLSASQSDHIDGLRISMNASNQAWNVAGIYVNFVDGTNISSLTIGSPVAVTGIEAVTSVSLSKTTTVNLARTSSDDEVWLFSSPIMLLEWDYITTGLITLEADGDGCATTTAVDMVDFWVFDKTKYRSQTSAAILEGYENDAATPADIGKGDIRYKGSLLCGAA